MPRVMYIIKAVDEKGLGEWLSVYSQAGSHLVGATLDKDLAKTIRDKCSKWLNSARSGIRAELSKEFKDNPNTVNLYSDSDITSLLHKITKEKQDSMMQAIIDQTGYPIDEKVATLHELFSHTYIYQVIEVPLLDNKGLKNE